MLPGDRLVCVFLKPQTAGTQFKDWLLHATIVPWFRLESSSRQVAEGLERALTAIGPFEAKAGEEVVMGPRKRQARLLQQDTGFTDIEQKVRNYLRKKRAWLVDETTKKPRQFRPHVTVQKSKELNEGQTFKVEKLYIVEQKGNYKEVVAEISLG